MYLWRVFLFGVKVSKLSIIFGFFCVTKVFMTSYDLVCMMVVMCFWWFIKLNSCFVVLYLIFIVCSIVWLLVFVFFFDLFIIFFSIVLTCCVKCARMYCLSNKFMWFLVFFVCEILFGDIDGCILFMFIIIIVNVWRMLRMSLRLVFALNVTTTTGICMVNVRNNVVWWCVYLLL